MASSTTNQNRAGSTADPRLRSALEQFREDCRLYNRAVGSYNTHLDNHRERRDLQDLSFRDPVTAHEAFDQVLDGDADAVARLLEDLLDEAHLDSRLRRHPGAYPIHLEAVDQLATARDQLVRTLEEVLLASDSAADSR